MKRCHLGTLLGNTLPGGPAVGPDTVRHYPRILDRSLQRARYPTAALTSNAVYFGLLASDYARQHT
jgi:hypothetical protein